MTGWGQEGPLASAPSHDPNMLAVTGALFSMGYADRPPLPPLNLVADYGGGAMFLVAGVLAALLHARATREGQVVDAAMADGVAALMTPVYAMRKSGQWRDERGVNFLDGSCPFGTSYETADGKHMMVAAIEPPFYATLLKGLGLSVEAAELPAQYDRKRWPELKARFAAVFRTKTRDEWTTLLENAGACVSPVLDMGEAQEHFHLKARGVFAADNVPAPAPRFLTTTGAIAAQTLSPAPELLADWGLGTDAVATLTST
jgi:alpha-methylacyl-CoA racemase